MAALQDADDSPFGASLRAAFDTDDDAIAVHRLGEIGRGDVDIRALGVRVGLIGNDKAEPARVRRESSDDEVHLFRQPVSIAADLEEFTGSDERLQLSPESGALVARYTQHPHQVPHSRGMMGMLANLGQ